LTDQHDEIITMINADGIISSSVKIYENVFTGYLNQFLQWGEWLFYSFVIIAIVWLCLWKAFDQNSFQESLPSFLKEFFIVAFFYTIMINCGPWLGSIVSTATTMGSALTHTQVDPSNIITDGILLGNLILAPSKGSGILSLTIGIIIASISYIIVLAAFISIALDLALTLIITSFLISISALFLAFAAFPFTRTVARNTLDVVIANSFKLLALYAVIAAGQDVFYQIENIVPAGKISNFDIYGWIVAAAVLFWLVSKNLPNQVAKIVTNVIQETRGTDAAALAMSATRLSQVATRLGAPIAGAVGGAASGLAKIASSSTNNAAAHFSKAKASGSGNLASAGAALSGSAKSLMGAVGDTVSQRFSHLNDKLAGGQGLKQRTPEGKELPLPGVANRMYSNAKDIQDSSDSPSSGNPSSAGRKAAAPSSTRSQPPNT
jgi:P-type conjugative transfer protein TrbL